MAKKKKVVEAEVVTEPKVETPPLYKSALCAIPNGAAALNQFAKEGYEFSQCFASFYTDEEGKAVPAIYILVRRRGE